MNPLSVALSGIVLGLALLTPTQGGQTFHGIITDSECADGYHGAMRMGPTDAECVLACVDAHGASFVLFDGRTTYALTDQKTPSRFAARRVTVTGTLDSKTNTIRVDAIAAAN